MNKLKIMIGTLSAWQKMPVTNYASRFTHHVPLITCELRSRIHFSLITS